MVAFRRRSPRKNFFRSSRKSHPRTPRAESPKFQKRGRRKEMGTYVPQTRAISTVESTLHKALARLPLACSDGHNPAERSQGRGNGLDDRLKVS
jgi:hypothetical protein